MGWETELAEITRIFEIETIEAFRNRFLEPYHPTLSGIRAVQKHFASTGFMLDTCYGAIYTDRGIKSFGQLMHAEKHGVEAAVRNFVLMGVGNALQYTGRRVMECYPSVLDHFESVLQPRGSQEFEMFSEQTEPQIRQLLNWGKKPTLPDRLRFAQGTYQQPVNW
ncbi:MAG: hypothetical protein OXR66_04925 [Candidatus Woesearchaeota archaeon]|nr:hypothetical protein [Candidatus Woesearchaeota archaeon]